MKLKFDFAVREIVGEYVMVPLGEGALKFAGMISTSETGALIAEMLKQDVTKENLLDRLLDTYEVDEATLAADLDEFLESLRKLDILLE